MPRKGKPIVGAVLNYVPELIVKPDWAGLKKIAQDVEGLGYDSLWVMDHFTYHGLPTVLECYTTLAALAASTSKIRLGALVGCNSYRLPTLTAKMAASLDVISNGRFNLGLGAGWKVDEYRMYGYDYPSARVRIEQLSEAVQVMKKTWTEPGASFSGKYYRMENMTFGPEPIQKPHPPVWIGGEGERYLLRVVAELADFSNISQNFTKEEYRHKMEVLKQHCSAVGRDYNEIKKSLGLEVFIAGTKEEARRKLLSGYEAAESLAAAENRPPTSIETYEKRKLVGTPETCVSELQEWLDNDVDYLMVGWTMTSDDWKLFAEKVVPNLG